MYSLRSFLKISTSLLLAVLLCSCGVDREFLYYPTKNAQSPSAIGLQGFAEVTVKDKDGTDVNIWQHAARKNYPTIVFFHGNGGDLVHRAEYFHLLAEAGYGVIGLDYRGYGKSKGDPSEEGFYQDARAAIAYATQIHQIPLDHLVLYGESIGTGVAVQMATEYQAGALVLQSPYTSIEALAKQRKYWLPVQYLVGDNFDSLAKIDKVHMPVLMMHGERDEVIPVQETRLLFAKAAEPKYAVFFPAAGHNNLNETQMTSVVTVFLRNQKLIPPE